MAEGRFGGKELGGEDFAGSVVLQAESGEPWAAAFEPVVRRAVELDQFAFASRAQATLAMSGSAAFARGAQAGLAQLAAESLATEREAFDFAQFFAEGMIIESGIGGAGQTQDRAAHLGR